MNPQPPSQLEPQTQTLAAMKSRPVLRRLIACAGVALLAGGLTAIFALRSQMIAEVGYQRAGPLSVSLNWPALGTPDAGPGETWLAKATQKDIRELLEITLSGDPTDQFALTRTHDALMATGWIAKVDAIRRLPAGKVEIDLTWRSPMAAVRTEGLDWIVSDKTEILPLHYAPGTSGMPLVINPTSPRPTKPGQVWIGGDVEAGIALLAHLSQHDEIMSQVRGVDVSRFASRRQLSIITDRGNRIIWGTPTNQKTPGEPSTEQKLAWLLEMRQEPRFNRRIDAGVAVVVLSNPAGVAIDHIASQEMELIAITASAPPALAGPPEAGQPNAGPPAPGKSTEPPEPIEPGQNFALPP